MNKMWLVTLLIMVLFGLAGNNAGKVWADFQEEYEAASDWHAYAKGDMAHINAKLVQKTTRALHRENMEILKELREIKKEILELKDLLEE